MVLWSRSAKNSYRLWLSCMFKFLHEYIVHNSLIWVILEGPSLEKLKRIFQEKNRNWFSLRPNTDAQTARNAAKKLKISLFKLKIPPRLPVDILFNWQLCISATKFNGKIEDCLFSGQILILECIQNKLRSLKTSHVLIHISCSALYVSLVRGSSSSKSCNKVGMHARAKNQIAAFP